MSPQSKKKDGSGASKANLAHIVEAGTIQGGTLSLAKNLAITSMIRRTMLHLSWREINSSTEIHVMTKWKSYKSELFYSLFFQWIFALKIVSMMERLEWKILPKV